MRATNIPLYALKYNLLHTTATTAKSLRRVLNFVASNS